MDDEIIKFLKEENITLTTNNKAGGHLGFFKQGKIALSKNLSKERQQEVLLHEYAHKVHSDIETKNFYKGGSLEKLFLFDNVKLLEEELLKVTAFVDENSKCITLEQMKNEYAAKVKTYEAEIKKEFPNFAKSKKFAEYDKYQRKTKSKTKYFLKYDHIKIFTPWLFKNEFYSIERLDTDFPDLPLNFKNYFYLLSAYRKQKKIQNKIAKLKRYYKRPTELFARFIEGLVINEALTQNLAPNAYKQYKMLEQAGYYKRLPELINMVKQEKISIL